jgi:hypothetical protein
MREAHPIDNLPESEYDQLHGSRGRVRTYGTQYALQDGASGACISSCLFWNGHMSWPLIERAGRPATSTPSSRRFIPHSSTMLPANAFLHARRPAIGISSAQYFSGLPLQLLLGPRRQIEFVDVPARRKEA